MADQGWLGAGWPSSTADSGSGWSRRRCCWRRSGATSLPSPCWPTLVALDAVTAAGPPDGVEHWVGRLVAGDAVGVSLALAATGRRPDRSPAGDPRRPAQRPATRRQVDRRPGPTVSGRVGPVVGAPVADVAVVATPDAVYGVELAAAGRPSPSRPWI